MNITASASLVSSTHQPEGHQVAESADQLASLSPHRQQYGTQPDQAKPPMPHMYQPVTMNHYIDFLILNKIFTYNTSWFAR